eukprot:SAG31_NODE_12598_length_930_cov_1.459687_1_plen_230_part_01
MPRRKRGRSADAVAGTASGECTELQQRSAKKSRAADSRRAFAAAARGDDRILRTLPPSELAVLDPKAKVTPAHLAAKYGHAHCLRAIAESGAAAVVPLVADPADEAQAAAAAIIACARMRGQHTKQLVGIPTPRGLTPAHFAAWRGKEDCLRVLAEVGPPGTLAGFCSTYSLPRDARWRRFDHNRRIVVSTPAHFAAEHGHAGCLRVLVELGAGSSLGKATRLGFFPAHF